MVKPPLPLRMLLVILLTGLFSPSFANNYHALLVGIDHYPSPIPSLGGALSDVALLKKRLENIPQFAQTVNTLTNEQATRSNILSAWNHLIKTSQSGDTILFSFSGHGYKQPDFDNDEKKRNPADQLDEMLLLSGFSFQSKQMAAHTLLDDELDRLFKRANAKGVKVIYLADTCFAGGSSRNVSNIPGLTFGKNRSLRLTQTQYSRLSDWLFQHWQNRKEKWLKPISLLSDSNESTFVFSSTDEASEVPEIQLDGKTYGPLSWSFSKALEEANLNGDNDLSHAELVDYLVHKLNLMGYLKHAPQFLPEKTTSERLLPVGNIPILNEPDGLKDKGLAQRKVLIDLIDLRNSAPNLKLNVNAWSDHRSHQQNTLIRSGDVIPAIHQEIVSGRYMNTRLELETNSKNTESLFLINYTILEDTSQTAIKCYPFDGSPLTLVEGSYGEQVIVLVAAEHPNSPRTRKLKTLNCFDHTNFVQDFNQLVSAGGYRFEVITFFIGKSG